jgi:FkbM family methyltransferase
MGSPVIRLLGVLSRRGFVSPARGAAAVTRALSLRDDWTVEIERPLDGGSGAHLRLDLRYSGCLELLVARTPGAPDVGTAALLIELARSAELVLDVGANVGLYTYLVAAAVPSVRVISFEPTPALATVVTDNVARNGWHPRVLVRREAVGAVSGMSTLYVLSHADTEHTLDPDRVGGRDYRTIQVPVVAIDDVLDETGAALDRTVLKIDVEGHERSALDGLERTLGTPGRRPDVIMEFLGRAIEQDHVVDRVLGYGIGVYYIGPGALTPLRATADLARVQRLGYWNFLLTSRPASDIRALGARVGVPVTNA